MIWSKTNQLLHIILNEIIVDNWNKLTTFWSNVSKSAPRNYKSFIDEMVYNNKKFPFLVYCQHNQKIVTIVVHKKIEYDKVQISLSLSLFLITIER